MIMSVSDVDLRKVGKVLFLGSLVWFLSFLTIWGAGSEWIQAMKIAIGPAVGWVVGNLAETGMTVPTMEGLRK
jgi:hypothetical protein